jgi:hypothetical protein
MPRSNSFFHNRRAVMVDVWLNPDRKPEGGSHCPKLSHSVSSIGRIEGWGQYDSSGKRKKAETASVPQASSLLVLVQARAGRYWQAGSLRYDAGKRKKAETRGQTRGEAAACDLSREFHPQVIISFEVRSNDQREWTPPNTLICDHHMLVPRFAILGNAERSGNEPCRGLSA